MDILNHNNSRRLQDKWNHIRHNYHNHYPNVREEDLSYQEGGFYDMTERIAKRTNRSRKDVLNEIDNW
ncbi:hypothetical protein [Winogradskyella ursingii]|uniref:hypothetical protein n=1 Tax=Winogradskyella ursingii TaxID=2686079 RepID=UPI0015CC9A34|nr:hypothetical protein [Winogradskyella ursingii]